MSKYQIQKLYSIIIQILCWDQVKRRKIIIITIIHCLSTRIILFNLLLEEEGEEEEAEMQSNMGISGDTLSGYKNVPDHHLQ